MLRDSCRLKSTCELGVWQAMKLKHVRGDHRFRSIPRGVAEGRKIPDNRRSGSLEVPDLRTLVTGSFLRCLSLNFKATLISRHSYLV